MKRPPRRRRAGPLSPDAAAAAPTPDVAAATPTPVGSLPLRAGKEPAGGVGRTERVAAETERSMRKAIGRAVVDSAVTRSGVALLTRLLPPKRVQLTRYEVVVSRLPRDLDGLRVLHLSDLHLHPGSDLAWQVPELIAAVPHDLTCYTGDFINIDADIPAVEELLAHMPRAEEAYVVLGNHDYIPFGRTHGANDVQRLRSVLTGAGLVVLANEARPVCGGKLYIVGVDDPATRRDDLDHALQDVPDDACSLLLAHSPDIVLRLGGRRPGLILAGHTHGGQVRLPRVGPLITLSRVPRHLAMGLGRYQDVPLFVSRGIGYSSLNVRLGSPPEVALLILRSPVDAGLQSGASG